MSGAIDVDLGLRDAGEQRGHGAHHVRRLEGAVDRELAPDLVHRGDAGAGLQRRRVDALIGDQLLDRHRGLGEGTVGRLAVADLPGEDVVVVLALAVRAVGLVADVLAQADRAVGHRLEGVVDRVELLVLDLDQLDRVGRDVAVVGDDEDDLLVLEQHLAVGQHRLDVAGQGRHPVQLERLQLLGGQHGAHARQRRRLAGVDALDPGMAIGAADEVAEQHAGQLDVVDIAAAALDEADILLALAGAADAAQRGFALFLGQWGRGVHSAASLWRRAGWRRVCTALTMFW